MKLNPLDIRKHEFQTRFRGYDPEEVDGFLQIVAQQWQELTDENRRQESRIEEQAAKLAHYAKVEEALEQALETAREGARQRLETADQRAAMTVQDAERRAAAFLADAESRAAALRASSEGEAKALLADARSRAAEALASAEAHLSRSRSAAAEAGMRRSEILVRLRSFLSSELELLAAFEGESSPADAVKENHPKTGGIEDGTVWVAGSMDAVRDFRDVDEVVVPPDAGVPGGAAEESMGENRTKAIDFASVLEEMDVAPFEAEDAPGNSPAETGGLSATADDAVAAKDHPGAAGEAGSMEVADAGVPEEQAPEVEPDGVGDTLTDDRVSTGEETSLPVADEAVGPEDVDGRTHDDGPQQSSEATGEVRPKRSTRTRSVPAKQAELLEPPAESGSASDEIRKIRRILEDLDR